MPRRHRRLLDVAPRRGPHRERVDDVPEAAVLHQQRAAVPAYRAVARANVFLPGPRVFASLARSFAKPSGNRSSTSRVLPTPPGPTTVTTLVAPPAIGSIAGKSTIFRLVVREEEPDSGTVHVEKRVSVAETPVFTEVVVAPDADDEAKAVLFATF